MILATVSSSSSFRRDVRAALDARFRFEAGWDFAYEDAARLQGVRSKQFSSNIIDFKNQAQTLPVARAMGGRPRGMGGEAQLTNDTGGNYAVTLDPSVHPGAHQARPGALQVLVAEDCDESFALTEMALEGQQVWRANNGQEALRMLRKQRFDVVFMDVHMPGMDGYEAIRRVRDWETHTGHARTPVVVLSSDDLETQQRSAAEFGCSGFLLKPLRRGDLLPLLERLKSPLP